MTLNQLLTREADVLANIVAAQLDKLGSQAGHLSNHGKLVVERAFAQFLATIRDPNEGTEEF
jgi:hypothetical protein